MDPVDKFFSDLCEGTDPTTSIGYHHGDQAFRRGIQWEHVEHFTQDSGRYGEDYRNGWQDAAARQREEDAAGVDQFSEFG